MPKIASNLESLPPEAQAQIIAWLESESRRKVVDRIAQSPPAGFGLKTHVTSLSRFYARYLAQDRPADVDLAKLLAPHASGDPVPAATQSVASDWALQLAIKPRRNLSGFKAVSRWVLKHRELEQREREVRLIEARLALDRDKWEFDIAHRVLLHHAELDHIRRDPATSDETKIDRARSTLFNRPAGELPPRPSS